MLIVYAKTDPEAYQKGITAFIVEKVNSVKEGVLIINKCLYLCIYIYTLCREHRDSRPHRSSTNSA